VESNQNLEKLRKAGILASHDSLTREDKEVIASLSSTEIDTWVRIKQKLDDAGIEDLPAKFFI